MGDARLQLPQVTLCAVTSVNVAATLIALERCLAQIDFAACKLLTDAAVTPAHPGIEVVPIAPLTSSGAYSDFLLTRLVDHVPTSHCMVAQWDGHVLDAVRWQNAFLDYDYIGASWPQFDDGHDVGNGGFSLRSRRLMELCRHPDFVPFLPEDVAIGRTNRDWLERQGIQFAPSDIADLFSAERTGDVTTSFGYHGVWNMPLAVGGEDFWQVYRQLDEHTSLRRDFWAILRSVMQGAGLPQRRLRRVLRMLADRIGSIVGR